ncbi:hypothetical protein [Streptomyces sp. NPDC054794]
MTCDTPAACRQVRTERDSCAASTRPPRAAAVSRRACEASITA